MNDIERHYESYEGLIERTASEYYRRYHRTADYQDVLQEARLIYLQAVLRYDPDKGAFSTFLVASLQALGRYCAKEYRYTVGSTDGVEKIGARERKVYLCLGEDAQAVQDAICEGVLEATQQRQRLPSLYQATRYFSHRGWSRGRTKQAWEELRLQVEGAL